MRGFGRLSVIACRLLIGAACASLPFSFARAQGTPPDRGAEREQPPEKAGEQATSANKSVVSREAIESERPQTSFDALKNVPGVINSDTKGGVSDDFSIRGIHLSETTSYRLNGSFPIENNIGLMDNKERVEALKGVGALI